MKREIKFRVWDTVAKRYDKNYHIQLNLNGEAYNLQNGAGGTDYIIQQFTGLTDEHGKEIYEGDILNQGYMQDHPTEVVFNDGMYFTKQLIDSWDKFIEENVETWEESMTFMQQSRTNELKIIGNIFENPELIPTK